MAYIGKTPSQAVRQRYYYTASGSETSLSGADDNSNTLAFSDGEYVDVSLNGISLVAGTDYNTSTANTIAGLSALAANDIVEIVVYDTFSVHSGTFNGPTTFNGSVSAATLTDTSNTGNVTLDFSANQNFVLTLTGNVTLVNPTTETIGQSGFIAFIQDSTGGRTVSLGTDYETGTGAGLTLSSAASKTDLVPYIVVAENRILLGTAQLDFS
tara:strand:- start:210 stop:845 length:636 start_codon:yes stop_codon:yes gene_type:complete